jgi:hypothetical protein
MSGQMHGKQFEDMLKALLYSGASDTARKATAKVDIEASFDKLLGLDTSVKVSKLCSDISLADARAFWAMNNPFRLLVACWKQKTPTIKEFYEIHEFIITPTIMQKLRGKVTLQQITELHNAITQFPYGQHTQARIYAKLQKRLLQPHTLITLNPKIDSKTQRRLQCSLKMKILKEVMQEYPYYQEETPHYILHHETMGNMVLPQLIKSEPRRFNNNT